MGVKGLKKESSILKIPFNLHFFFQVHVIGLPILNVWVVLNQTGLPLLLLVMML